MEIDRGPSGDNVLLTLSFSLLHLAHLISSCQIQDEKAPFWRICIKDRFLFPSLELSQRERSLPWAFRKARPKEMDPGAASTQIGSLHKSRHTVSTW